MIVSKTKEVSIYREGSIFKKCGTLHLEKGSQNIQIGGLSSTLDPNTIRLFLPEQVSCGNVQPKTLTSAEKDEKLLDMQNKLHLLEANIEAKRTQLTMWTANADFSQKDSLNVAEMADYIEKLPTRLQTIEEELIELTNQQKDLQKQRDDLFKEVNQYYLSVDVEAKEAADYPYEVTYFESNAGWVPFYEIHTKEDDTLSLLLRARIYQNTNEDIKQTKVTLYTGNPSLSSDIPSLHPQRLRIDEPIYGAGNRFMGMAKMMVAESTADEDALEEEYEMAPMLSASATKKQSDTMMEYVLPGLIDLDKENPHTCDLIERTINCKYHDIAIPKLDNNAYLAAEVKLEDITDIINSSALIYHKGLYVGEVYIEPDAEKDTYDISLGKDETIKLKREQKKKYTSKTMLSGQKVTEFIYELFITSTKDKTWPVTIYDQIPVSTDKSITVDKVNISSGELNEETGEVKWVLDIEPNETKSLTVGYNVSWPKDKNINI